MKVNSVTQSIYKNKAIKKGLEYAANNGTLFAAGTSLVMSTFIRPLSILATPKTDKENKKLACAKSIASSTINFGLLFCISKPLAKSIERIDKAPKKYLKPSTIKALKEDLKPIQDSKAYQTATQIFKLGLGILIAAPKSILTSDLTPKINNIIEPDRKKHSPSFKGRTNLNPLSKTVGKIIDKPTTQKFANNIKDSNYPMHIAAITDTISTFAFVKHTQNKDIKKDRKDVLCKNTIISTGLCIGGGYTLDKALDKPTQKFIKGFSKANKNSPKLAKYIEGIKIAKPTLILGTIYYAMIPMVSTFFAERVGNKNS